MAFTFEVEDGSGSSTATSYVSVEEADDIIYLNIHANTSWDALSNSQKERLLSYSSSNLDSLVKWFGQKTVETSSLRWPRSGVCDNDGIVIDTDLIPPQLKKATAEYARFIIDEDRTVDKDQNGLDSIKVDVIEIDFWDGYSTGIFPSFVSQLLNGLGMIRGTNGMSFVQLVR